MKNTKDFYNKTAQEWADKFYNDDAMMPLLEAYISKLPENAKVLDLCCGPGYESMRMRNLGAQVIGLDFSESCIQLARKRNPNMAFHVGDMLEDYSHIGKVDGIAVIAGLVHLPNEKLEIAFKEMSKVLENKGLILMVVRDGIGKSDKSSYVKIDDESYDRDFYAHTLEELIRYSAGIFKYVEEVVYEDESIWKNYIFMKPEE